MNAIFHPTVSCRRALLAGLLLVLPVAVCAQAAGAQDGAQAQGAQATPPPRAGSSTGTRGAQSDSSDWQQSGKTDTQAAKADADAANKPARSTEANATGDDFDTLDTDHDGRISRAEAGASQAFNARFKTLDADGDGYVSNAEYREGLRATRAPTAAP
jgi:hypothetical protein